MHDPLQKHMVWLSGALGAGLVAAAATVLLLGMNVLRNPADVIADFVTLSLTLTVVGLLEVGRERRAVARHRDLVAMVDAAEARVYRAVEEAKIEFQTRQSEDRMALQDLITRNYYAIVERENQHKRERWNALADGVETALGGRDVVDATGTHDISPKMSRVVPIARNKDCRG